MQTLTEVMGNVYFCDFENGERETARAAFVRPAATRSVIVDIKLLVAQINAASKEIVAAHAEIARQSREQSRDLLAMLNVIDGIVSEADITALESPHRGADEMRELAQGALAAANELRALAREQVVHVRNAARRLADIGRDNGLIEHTVA